MKTKKLLAYIFGTIVIGGIFSFLTINNDVYNSLIKPSLTPPMILFPIVWSILFIIMGISLYLISESSGEKRDSYIIYFIQLVFNSLWTLLFFGFNLRLLSSLWLLVLIILILIMIIKFYKINKVAGLIQIPYLLWVLFATYLTFGIYFLNK